MTMETLEPGQAEVPPSYRSFEELRREGVRVGFSPATRRLFWPLDGVFPTAISVMKTAHSADDLESFFQSDTEGAGSVTWHEIAQLPLTEPKVSSIEASVSDLEEWEFDWIAWHKDHDGPEFGQEYVTYGDLDDETRPYANKPREDGSWEEDPETKFLVKCCGDDRPLRKRGLKLVVTPPVGSNSHVTVLDYVSAVHPWLMSLHGDIINTKTVARPQPYPASASTEWMVDKGPKHRIEVKESWVREHGGGPPHVVPASTAAILARIRAKKNR